MWINQNIELPPEVIDAQRKGELVIFAGAGMSMAPPSCLPGFEALADQISEGIVHRCPDDSLDVYLGSLESRNINVHERAIEILKNPQSRPNSYHINLLRLFPEDQVRIVTTNFDDHFKTAAETLGLSIPYYSAPALPLGRDFSGVVQLHGSISGRPRDLILTDSDFGRAYFTDGWATTFLRGLFSHYLVLFIGYSANDVVMKYFARGLGPNNKARYAIAEGGHGVHWNHLKINVSEYPEGEHQLLQKAIEDWATRYKMGALEHKRLIKEIAENPPDYNNKIEESYTIEQLKNDQRAKYFFESAKNYEWVRWFDHHKMLDPLFHSNNKSNSYNYLLASWVSRFIEQDSENLLEIVMGNGHVNEPFLHGILYQLKEKQSTITSKRIAKWLPVYLNQINYREITDLTFLLEKMNPKDNKELIILLMDYLTQPYAKYREKLSQSESNHERVDIDIFLHGNPYQLENVWEKVIKPNLDCFAEPLMGIFVKHMRMTSYYLRSVYSDWDPVSFLRSAIEKHSQDSYPHNLDFLINHCRDALEFLSKNNRRTAELFIYQCINSNSYLLKRIAIHGYRLLDGIAADKKLKWILDNELLWNYWCKHEVYMLIRSIYPKLKPENRKGFIQNISDMIDRKKEKSPSSHQRSWEYEKFNLYYWLTLSDNNCSIAKKAFDQARSKNKFSVWEHPEFNSWMSGVKMGGGSVTSLIEEVRAKDPEEASDFEWLLTYKNEDALIPDEKRGSLINAADSVIRKDKNWGWRLINQLSNSSNTTSDLWRAVLDGFRGAFLLKQEWVRLGKLLLEHCALSLFKSDIAFLFSGSIQVKKNDFTECTHLVVEIYHQIYDSFENADSLQEKVSYEAAINHPIGGLIEFFCDVFFETISIEPDHPLISELKSLFTDLLLKKDTLSEMGKVIVAYNLYAFLTIDESWSKNYLVPLFNAKEDKDIAKIMWSGYAYNVRWNERALSCYYEELLSIIPVINELDPGVYDGIFRLIASILFNSPEYEKKLIKYFIYHVKSKLLFQQLMKHILWILNDLDQSAVENNWHLWLKEYLNHRMDNLPMPITHEELNFIIDMFPLLEPVIGEYVALIVKKDMKVDLQAQPVFYQVEEKALGKKSPNLTLDFLDYVFKHLMNKSFFDYRNLSLIMEQICDSLQSKSDKFESVCNELLDLGDMMVEELIEKYKKRFENDQ